MTTDDLLAYIRTQIDKDTPKDSIFSRLSSSGWHMDDIQEGWDAVSATQEHATPQASRALDPYREIPDETPTDNTLPMRTPFREPELPHVTKSEPTVWVPKTTPVTEKPVAPSISPVLPISTTPSTPELIDITKPIAPQMSDIPTIVAPAIPAIPVITTPHVSVDVPRMAPITPSLPKILQAQSIQPQSVELLKPTTPTKPIDIPKPTISPVVPPAPVSTLPPIPEIPSTPLPQPAVVHHVDIPKVEKAEPAPSPVPVPIPTDMTVPKMVKKIPDITTRPIENEVPQDTNMRASMPSPSSNTAMIASYPADVSSVGKVQTRTHTAIPKSVIKWTLVSLVAIAVIGGGAFAFTSGLIKIPLLVKKDPTTALLSAAVELNALHSYKTETTLTVSMPSLSSITTGLANGQAVKSNDTETVTVDAVGAINNKSESSPGLADYATTITSSLMQDPIVSDLKYDNATAYVAVPDLTALLGTYAPRPATVAVHAGDLVLLVPQLPQNIQNMITYADPHDMLSKGLPSNAKALFQSAIAAFIENAQVTQSGEEDIKGVPTYHYQVTANHDTTKALLSQITAIFVPPLPADQKQNLDEALGSASFDSFDVWVGRDDGQIYQYQFTLTAPLSAVIALNDGGIAGKQVSFTWKKTYYDFNVANDITMPQNAVSMHDFVNTILDAKIKSTVASFTTVAKNLSNAEGHFGTSSNTSGSCTSPQVGSLFSPTGHAKGATTQVSAVAMTMQTLLGATGNTGSCYSTSHTWAIEFPLATNPASYYCADSAGTVGTLSSGITGASCK
jgi:hypothetical protein